MSRGPDNIITETLTRETDCPDPGVLAEEILDALEAENYLIVDKIQVRSYGEMLKAMGVPMAEVASGDGDV